MTTLNLTNIPTFEEISTMKFPKGTVVDEKTYSAAVEYYKRKERISHPAGSFDKAGRWYPDHEEGLNGFVASNYRTPSRAYPFTLMSACRSCEHVASLFGVYDNVLSVRRIAKVIRSMQS